VAETTDHFRQTGAPLPDPDFCGQTLQQVRSVRYSAISARSIRRSSVLKISSAVPRRRLPFASSLNAPHPRSRNALTR
jgi:hypothetical protein